MIVVVVLPTPPFWLATAMTRGSGPADAARRRARRRQAWRPREGSSRAGLSVGHSGPGRAARHSLTRWRRTGQAPSTDGARCFTWNIAAGEPLTLEFHVKHRPAGSRPPGGRRARPSGVPTASTAASGQRSAGGSGGSLTTSETAGGEQGSGAAQRLGRGPEAPRDDGVDRDGDQARAVPRRRPPPPRPDPPAPSRLTSRRRWSVARGPTIDEHEAQVGAGPGDHQTGHAAAAAEVDDRAAWSPARASTKAPACSMTSSIGRSPSIPRRCDAAERLGQRPVASSDGGSAGRDDHPAVGILALGPAGHAVDRGRGRRGGPCGRPTASGRGSGRRPSRAPARRPWRRSAPGRPDASPGTRRHRRAAASRGHRGAAGRRPGPGPGSPAACGRRGRSSARARSPSTRTSISVPSTSASTSASNPKAVVRPLMNSSAAVRTASTSTSLGSRSPWPPRTVAHRWSWCFLRCWRSERRLALAASSSTATAAGVGRGTFAAAAGGRARRHAAPAVVRLGRRSTAAIGLGAVAPPRRPRRRSCFGRTGAGRTRARTRASPRSRPNNPGLGVARISKSASSATTPS